MQKTEFFYPSCDEIHDIHAIVWKPEGDVRAMIQISHGMTEYTDRYEEVAEYMTARGILVFGNDHLGHGESVMNESEWGFFASGDASEKVVRDLHTLSLRMRREYPNVPVFLLGHSMGSFMARRYAMTYGTELDGAIFVGTGNQTTAALRFAMTLVNLLSILYDERHKSRLVEKLMFGAYNKRLKPARTQYDWLSRNTENVDKYSKDKACTFLFTLNGYKTLLSTLLFIQKPINIISIPAKLPVLLLSGEEDPVGNYGQEVRQLYMIYKKRGIKDLSIKLYPQDRHEILNELDRKDVYEYLYNWVNKRI